MSHEPINSALSRQQLEKELNRTRKRHDRNRKLERTALWILVAIMLAATLSAVCFPILLISDETGVNSGRPHFVLTMRTKTLQYGDKVACYRENEVVILQVVATAGDSIDFDDRGCISVNGNKQYAVENSIAITTVPDGSVLLLDQSGEEVCCVQSDEITGKVILRIWPLS